MVRPLDVDLLKFAEYSVRETYETRPLDVDLLKFADTWNTYAPMKMATTILRKFQNKIPTKDNLPKRGVLIKLQANCASYGCGVIESRALHIFSLNVTYTCRSAWGLNLESLMV
ncbi:hypothetical protein A2U01_0022404 [Trifolium medium]|uniref:Reverse transcriptase zinc-binding domain-containing protein n=1 Tax=Trifolium medium TaxID=97028 RepID=A0A392NQG9_9FABA|nr:hypothetical protein [Trifolium medium]